MNASPQAPGSVVAAPGGSIGRTAIPGADAHQAAAGWRPLVRAVVRLSGLGAVIALTMLFLAIDALRKRGFRRRAHRLQWASRTLLRVMKIHYASEGRHRDGAIIASNHLSYLDVLVLSAITPVVFVAKEEVRSWPGIGRIAALAGTRFIDRTLRSDVKRVAAELEAVLREGVSVVLFLEGTSTDGREVRPFKPSLLAPAVTHGWPVVPAALSYDVPPGHSAAMEVCWWGDMTLPPHVRNLASLPWVRARVNWGEPLIGFPDRKDLARAAHERVAELHAKACAARE